MKKMITKYLIVSLAVFVVALTGCGNSATDKYAAMLKAAKTTQNPSNDMFLGFTSGMNLDEYSAHMQELVAQGKVQKGEGGFISHYVVVETKSGKYKGTIEKYIPYDEDSPGLMRMHLNIDPTDGDNETNISVEEIYEKFFSSETDKANTIWYSTIDDGKYVDIFRNNIVISIHKFDDGKDPGVSIFYEDLHYAETVLQAKKDDLPDGVDAL